MTVWLLTETFEKAAGWREMRFMSGELAYRLTVFKVSTVEIRPLRINADKTGLAGNFLLVVSE